MGTGPLQGASRYCFLDPVAYRCIVLLNQRRTLSVANKFRHIDPDSAANNDWTKAGQRNELSVLFIMYKEVGQQINYLLP